MTQYDPPSGTNDLEGSALGEWHEFVAKSVREIASAPIHKGNSFFDLTDGSADDGRETQQVDWDAYPASLSAWFDDPEAAYAAAESHTQMQVGFTIDGDAVNPVNIEYRQPDEYCEWHTEREGDYVRRVVFSSETADYWEFLAKRNFPRVLELYRKLVDPSIAEDDLRWREDVWTPKASPKGWAKRWSRGDYNPWNRWNATEGIVHSTHPDNTLSKAAMLIVGASVLREDAAGRAITTADRLICASGFGDPNRTSDPFVGFYVNAQVQSGREVSLANPVGIYMAKPRSSGFTAPDGSPVSGLWRCDRGDEAKELILRLVFEVPEDLPFVRLDGVPVTSGAQLARRIRMKSHLSIRPREPSRSAPPAQPAIACCVPRPERDSYRGVFFPDMDWPPPPETGPRLAASQRPGAAPAATRWDSAVLNDIAAADSLQSRWSRWSMVGPTRWSGGL